MTGVTNAAVAGELVGGRYRLEEPIGQGAMGRVWRTRDELLEREVAVKEILVQSGLEGEQQEVLIRRVMREARAAARLNHPGIVTIHDIVQHKGVPLLVMEFIRGGSLGALLRREGRLPPERVAEIGFEVLDAIRTAHEAGIVHRDLKPDNILLDGRRAVITDFGTATLADSTVLTRAGTVLGTPLYMAPEQIEGRPATGAADLWSIGATLYTAVEGEPPFNAPTLAALFNAILNHPPRPPQHAGALGFVLAGLLHKTPELRLSAARTAEALKTFLAGKASGAAASVALPPPGPPPGPDPQPLAALSRISGLPEPAPGYATAPGVRHEPPPAAPTAPPAPPTGPQELQVPVPHEQMPQEPEPQEAEPREAGPQEAGHEAETGSRDGQDGQDGVLYGTVKWFKAKKGYGFITPDSGDDDVYVHYSRIEMPGFKTLEAGGRVSYEVVRGKRGPEAARVRPL